MRRLALALVLLPLLAATAAGHPRYADNHNGCVAIGYVTLGPGTPPVAHVTSTLSEWGAAAGPTYPDNLCVPPGGGSSSGANFSSHAGSCLGKAPGTAIPGAYCGGFTSGTIRCVVQDHPASPPQAYGVIVGVDANLDGYVNQFDAPLYPDRTTFVSEWLGGGVGGMPAEHVLPTTGSTPLFPAGNVIAYLTLAYGIPASGTGDVLVRCF